LTCHKHRVILVFSSSGIPDNCFIEEDINGKAKRRQKGSEKEAGKNHERKTQGEAGKEKESIKNGCCFIEIRDVRAERVLLLHFLHERPALLTQCPEVPNDTG